MNVGGVTTNYPINDPRRTGKAASTDQSFAQQMNHVSKSNGFTLHWFDVEGEPIGACGLADGGSVTVYKPKGFDPENPIYQVKIWDGAGNVTERTVDIAKVDFNHCDYIDGLAYASHLTDCGKCPEAQSAFIRAQANPHGEGTVFDSITDKMNWMGILKYAMQLQFDLGNMAGYIEYKKFWDFLNR